MMDKINLRRLFLNALIVSVGLSAVIGIGVILFGDFGNFEVRVLMTTLTVTVTSIFGLACGAYLETRKARLMPVLGIILSIAAAVMCLLIIWDLLDDQEVFVKSFVSTSLLAAACSHLSLLSLARLEKRFEWTRIAAHLFVWSLAALLLYIIWLEPPPDNDTVARVMGVLGILTASVTVLTPVLHKISSTDTDAAKIDAEIERLNARIAELQDKKADLVKSASITPAEESGTVSDQ